MKTFHSNNPVACRVSQTPKALHSYRAPQEIQVLKTDKEVNSQSAYKRVITCKGSYVQK